MLTEQLRNQGPAPIQKYGIIMGWEIEKSLIEPSKISITGYSAWCKSTQRYRASISVDNNKKALGSYKSKKDSDKALEIGMKYMKNGGRFDNVRNHVDKGIEKWRKTTKSPAGLQE